MGEVQKQVTVGVVATCDELAPAWVEKGVALLEQHGFAVKLAANIGQADGRLAGTWEARWAGFTAMAADPTVDVLLNATGGFGANHFIGHLAWESLKNCGKAVIGFSDFTFFLNAWQAQGVGLSWHAQGLGNLAKSPHSPDCAALLNVLATAGKVAVVDPQAWQHAKVMAPGMAVGKIYGGNLAILVNSLGTPFAPPRDQPGILFIEEICETIARVDRWLYQLELSGYFEQLQGVLVGRMSNMADTESRPYGFDLQDVLRRHFVQGGRRIPVVTGLECGHAGLNFPLPFGALMRLEASASGMTLEAI